MTSLESVYLDLHYEVLLLSKLQRKRPQNVFPIQAETAIPIVWSDVQVVVQYPASSIGRYKSP